MEPCFRSRRIQLYLALALNLVLKVTLAYGTGMLKVRKRPILISDAYECDDYLPEEKSTNVFTSITPYFHLNSILNERHEIPSNTPVPTTSAISPRLSSGILGFRFRKSDTSMRTTFKQRNGENEIDVQPICQHPSTETNTSR